MRSSRGSLLAAMAIAMMGAEAAQAAMPVPRKGGNRDYKARWPKEQLPATALESEIAEWNAAVDRRKAEKKATKLKKRGA